MYSECIFCVRRSYMGLTKEKATLAIALGQFIKKIDVALDRVFRLVLVCPVTSKNISRKGHRNHIYIFAQSLKEITNIIFHNPKNESLNISKRKSYTSHCAWTVHKENRCRARPSIPPSFGMPGHIKEYLT